MPPQETEPLRLPSPQSQVGQLNSFRRLISHQLPRERAKPHSRVHEFLLVRRGRTRQRSPVSSRSHAPRTFRRQGLTPFPTRWAREALPSFAARRGPLSSRPRAVAGEIGESMPARSIALASFSCAGEVATSICPARSSPGRSTLAPDSMPRAVAGTIAGRDPRGGFSSVKDAPGHGCGSLTTRLLRSLTARGDRGNRTCNPSAASLLHLRSSRTAAAAAAGRAPRRAAREARTSQARSSPRMSLQVAPPLDAAAVQHAFQPIDPIRSVLFELGMGHEMRIRKPLAPSNYQVIRSEVQFREPCQRFSTAIVARRLYPSGSRNSMPRRSSRERSAS